MRREKVHRDTPTVRRPAEKPVQAEVPCIRFKVRIDFYPLQGEWDFSVIGWSHPEGAIVSNWISSTYDQWHVGLAPADLAARIVEMIESIPEPF